VPVAGINILFGVYVCAHMYVHVFSWQISFKFPSSTPRSPTMWHEVSISMASTYYIAVVFISEFNVVYILSR